MEPTEFAIAFQSAMDDLDPSIVTRAFEIFNDKSLTVDQKTEALWALLRTKRS